VYLAWSGGNCSCQSWSSSSSSSSSSLFVAAVVNAAPVTAASAAVVEETITLFKHFYWIQLTVLRNFFLEIYITPALSPIILVLKDFLMFSGDLKFELFVYTPLMALNIWTFSKRRIVYCIRGECMTIWPVTRLYAHYLFKDLIIVNVNTC